MTDDCHRGGCGGALAVALTDGGPPADAAHVATLLEGLPDNWGRWGADDERGTLNLLGSAEAAAGMRAALAEGDDAVERFTLGLPLTGAPIDPDGGPTETGDPSFPGRGVARRDNVSDARTYRDGERDPLAGMKFADDRFVTPFYLHGTTHVDALGHAWYGDTLYNGFDAATTATPQRFDAELDCVDGAASETRGLARASVAPLAEAGIAGRGVLLDVARHLGGGDEGGGDEGGGDEGGGRSGGCAADSGSDERADRLPLGTEVTLEDLQATARAQGVSVRRGDVLLIRTGSIGRTRDPDARWDPTDEPGLVFSRALVEWIADRDVAVLGADTVAVERVTQRIDGETYLLPLHGAFLRNLGMPLVELLWLDDLAATCAADGVYEFLFTAAPLHVERATGAPTNPVVLKADG